jgi:hypothetical protein
MYAESCPVRQHDSVKGMSLENTEGQVFSINVAPHLADALRQDRSDDPTVVFSCCLPRSESGGFHALSTTPTFPSARAQWAPQYQ